MKVRNRMRTMILRQALHEAHCGLKHALASVRARWAQDLVNRSRPVRALDLSQLEERVLLSASPVPPTVEGATAGTEDAALADTTASVSTSDSGPEQTSATSTSDGDLLADTRHELVIIDTQISDYQDVIGDIRAGSSDYRELNVAIVDSDRDGIEQLNEILTQLLSQYGPHEIDSIHLISHGMDGAVKLGTSWLTSENIGSYMSQLTAWQDALSADADLLIYGCDVAAGASGQTFVQSLSTLTGADVAASDDWTGHYSLGANWDLEYSTGSIETQNSLSIDFQSTWINLLGEPDLETSSGALWYSQGSGAVAVDSGLTVTSNPATLLSATVAIATNYVNGEDVLAFTDQLGITGSWDASTGILTLIGNASDTDYQTALRSVTYLNTNVNNPSTATRTVIFEATNIANEKSDKASRDITIDAVNDAPVNFVPATQSTDEDAAFVFSSGNANQISINDVDAGGSSIEVTLVGTNGEITLAGSSGLTFSSGDGIADSTLNFRGTIADINAALDGLSFTPLTNSFGAASLSITTNDLGNTGSDGAKSDSDTVAITVSETNDRPVAADDALITNEDVAISGNVLLNDSEPDNSDGIAGNEDTLSAVLDSGPANGTLVFNADGAFTYTPDANYFGSDSFTYHAVDGDGDASSIVPVTITVNSVNDTPVAVNNSYTVPVTDKLVIPVADILRNDSDADGDFLTVSIVDGPSNGALHLNGKGSVTYKANSSFIGTDSFTYQVTDGTATAVASVTLDVSAPPDGPAAIPIPERVAFPPSESTSPTSMSTFLAVPEPISATSVPLAQLHDGRTGLGDHLAASAHSDRIQGDYAGSLSSSYGAPSNVPIQSGAIETIHWTYRTVDHARRAARKIEPDQLGFSSDTNMLWEKLDSLRDQLASDLRYQVLTVGAAMAMSTAFTAGYVIWTLRGGYLIATVISSVPAWRMMDPLPILDSFERSKDRKDDDEDETLASLVSRTNTSDDSSN